MKTTNSPPLPRHADSNWLSRDRLLVLVLIAVTFLAFYLCFRLLLPFLPALAWALALAVVARPLHDQLATWITNANCAAALAVVLVGLMLVVPGFLIVHRLVNEAAAGVERIQTDGAGERWRTALELNPALAPVLEWLEANFNVQEEVQRVVRTHVQDLAAALTGSVWAVVQMLITLFALFYFFRDRSRFLQAVRKLVPLSTSETTEVFRRVADMIHATVYGTVLVALVQGALGGLMFWWLGLPQPLLWGVVMALLAVIPWLGAFVIWVPAAAVLALDGYWGRALLLTAWGTVVVGLIDNVLYPLFVGQRMRLHTLPVFVAIVGGLIVFGMAGVILGPVILTLTNALVDIWRRRAAVDPQEMVVG